MPRIRERVSFLLSYIISRFEEGDRYFHLSPSPWARLNQLPAYIPFPLSDDMIKNRNYDYQFLSSVACDTGRGEQRGRGGRCTPRAGMFSAHLHKLL